MQFIPSTGEAPVFSSEVSEKYLHLQLPFAEVQQMSGSFGIVISQQVKGKDFTIWKHDFFIDLPVLLHPYVPEGIHTINYMLKGNIPCELVGFGKLQLCEDTYNLYFVPPVKQQAWLSEGSFSCLHIDLNLDYLNELAAEFKPLSEFLAFTSAGSAKVMKAVNYPIDGNIRLIIQDIIQCKETGVLRNVFLRSRIYDLLLIFTRDLLKEDQPVFRVDDTLLEEIRTFLKDYYYQPVTILTICHRFGISNASLRKKFKAKFKTTIHRFLTKQRMDASILLLDRCESVQKVAIAVGYSDSFSFTKAFKAYYGCSPSNYINRDKEG